MPASIDAAATLTLDDGYTDAGACTDTPAPVPLIATDAAAPPRHDESSPSDEAQPGQVVAGRYTLFERLGGGAHGDVWAADDRVLGDRVALKWMRAAHGSMLARIRREITTLRTLRIPGAVKLVDDGVEHGRPFLVMELVEGRPFPGTSATGAGTSRCMTWQSLVGPTLALLEILSRVHANGVVHRDLKPDNILVRPDGRPTILDFGISLWGEPNAERLTGAGQIVGTPLYLAPEQILGRAVDARTDLYAVGVMLHEALTDRIPHEAPDVPTMLRARLLKPARPVQELAPDLPPVVAQVVDRLLATRIEDRFASAAEVIAALRGESTSASPTLPWLGSRHPALDVAWSALAGRSVDIVGPPGSGRSRCLRDAAEAITIAGHAALWTRPSRSPLGSLQPALGAPSGEAELRLSAAIAWAEGALRAELASGTVVLADDAERLDPWSAEIIERCRGGPGVVIRALVSRPPEALPDDVVELSALDEASLSPLFAGPDRLFHLREDAARALWERTDGLPVRIEAELLSWTRLGLARRDDAGFVVDRDSLGRLQAGRSGLATTRAAMVAPEDEPEVEDALRWLSLAGRPLAISQLARAMGRAPWRVEAACDALVSRGGARRRDGESIEARSLVELPWSAERRAEAHRAIAGILSAGDEGRLHHLLSAGLGREAASEAVAAARRHAAEGDLGAATAALAEGWRAARQQGEAALVDEETRILSTWAEVAFAEGTPRALDRVLYELTRASAHGPALSRLEALLRAALAAPGAGGLQALEKVDDIAPFSDAELERRRHRVRVVAAATRASASLVEDVLEDVEAWAEQSRHPLALLTLTEGRARQRYHEGRFEEAAALHAKAAALEPWKPGRIAAILYSASALLEAFRHEEAATRAEEGRELAANCRNPYWEGRAEWLLRSARYRMGNTQGPDLELVDAVARVGVVDLEALVCLNEAAAAMRAEAHDEGAALADRAATIWRGMGRPWATTVARALAIACGAVTDADEVEVLAERALACKGPGVGIQALGLLGRAFPAVRGRFRGAVAGLVRDVPEAHWDQRMDVLSVNEALELAGISGR